MAVARYRMICLVLKSKRFDVLFNDTSRYLDDIFTMDNPEFEKHIPDIYPAELQLNKVNTSNNETSFLDLNIKVIGSNITPYNRIEHSTRIHHISDRQREGLLWSKFVMYETPF